MNLCYICGAEIEMESTCDKCRAFKLEKLLIHAQKELGEIAECAIKKNRPGHWKNELGDLCGLCIAPMLEHAGMDFETACRIGRERKKQKIADKSR